MSNLDHSPYEHLAPVYRRASFEAQEQTGNPRIGSETTIEIARQAGISIGESAAFAYLARNEVEEFILDGQIEIEQLITGEMA